MEYTAQQAAEAARNIGVDLEGEKIRPEALAAGMAVEAARHGTKDAATNIVAEDPVIAAKLALANLRVSPNYYSPKAGVTAWEKSLARGAKQQGRKTEYKTLLFNVDDYDEEQGIFSGYGSVFGNVDDGGDIVEPGAFTKTIAEGFERVKILALHNDSLLPIGRPLEVREDSKGLYIKAKISDTAMGRDVKVLLKDGVLNELSIGYDPIVFDYDETGIRHLREVKLWEVSVVGHEPRGDGHRLQGRRDRRQGREAHRGRSRRGQGRPENQLRPPQDTQRGERDDEEGSQDPRRPHFRSRRREIQVAQALSHPGPQESPGPTHH